MLSNKEKDKSPDSYKHQQQQLVVGVREIERVTSSSGGAPQGGGGEGDRGGGRGGGGGRSYVITTAAKVSREVGNEGHGSIYIEKVVPSVSSFKQLADPSQRCLQHASQLAKNANTLK